MPIHKMTFKEGIFFAHQVGYVNSVDLQMWANALNKYARSTPHSLVAIIDLREAERVCPTVLKVITGVLGTGNLIGITIVVGDNMASRNERILSKLGGVAGVTVLSSVKDAYALASTRLSACVGEGATFATSPLGFSFAM